MTSKKKKRKKKGHRADRGILFSDFMLISKKKVLRLSSASFLRASCDIRGAVNRSCLRFLAGNKNAGFWREKKRRNSQNFSAKMPEKNFALFALFCAYREHCFGDLEVQMGVGDVRSSIAVLGITGLWPDCWVSTESLRAPIPRKGSGSTTTTTTGKLRKTLPS